MSPTKTETSPLPSASRFTPENPGDFLPILFFAALFFLSSADLFFAVRIHDFNFRSGQLLLLAGALVTLVGFFQSRIQGHPEEEFYWTAVRYWLPFFGLYALAALLSPNRSPSLIKWVWVLFNMGGAILVCLNNRGSKGLEKGFYCGLMAIAMVIWAQFMALYCFWSPQTISPAADGHPPSVFLNGFFLGYAQDAGQVGDTLIYRPNAFFYEPSYAGCALTFGFPLCLAMGLREGGSFWKRIFVPAFILGADWMTTSRSAILGTLVQFTVIVLGGLALKQKGLLKTLGKVLLAVLFLLGVLAISEKTRTYAAFFLGIVDPTKVVVRMGDANSSEGWRIANMINSLKIWAGHPLLGVGVLPLSANRGLHGLGLTSEDMWLEVGVETGLLGFMAFIFGLYRTTAGAWRGVKDKTLWLLIAAALAAHGLVSMNFTSTFPRLDYWLLFFTWMRLGLSAREKNPA